MRRALIMMAVLLPVACAKTEQVVDEMVTLDQTPKEVAFLAPVMVRGPRRELCLEFDRSGESRRAADIHAVLVTTEGKREELRPLEVDRRGEALVCLLHQTDATTGDPVQYRGVILSSPTSVRLRQIRWWSG